MRPRRVALALAVACAPVAAPALGRPQGDASVQAAVCTRGTHDDWVDGACFFGAAHGDVLFLRESPDDFGLGPYVRIGTASFRDLRLESGASLLLPVHDTFPVVVSVGPAARYATDGWQWGLASTVFFGSRSYNYHGNYALSAGLVAGLHYGLPSNGEVVTFVGAQVDAFFLVAPFALLYQALRR